MKFSASPLLLQKLPSWRARVLLGFFMAGFVVMAGRAFYLQVVQRKFLLNEGQARFERILTTPATRGLITDRYGNILALSTPVRSVWVIPDELRLSNDKLKSLARLLNMPMTELTAQLKKGGQNFVYLRRQIDAQKIAPILAGEYPGVFTDQEYRRYYPMGEVAAQVVGLTGIDGQGLEGMELILEQQLKGQTGRRRVIRDRQGRIVEDVQYLSAPQNGSDITLSLDNRIQYSAFNHLQKAVENLHARAGSVVVVDVHSGEILAMANWPSYNPNRRSEWSGPALRNRAVTDTFEPGSTLKPFTVALALQDGIYTPNSRIDTRNGKISLSHFVISDTSRHGVLTVSQVVQKSSNVGVIKIAQQLQDKDLGELLVRLGFGRTSGLQFPGESSGRLMPWQKWSSVERMTVSYGYGITVNLLQLARAYLSFARNGDMPDLTLLRSDNPGAGRQIFAAATANNIRKILEKVTEDGGTGVRARVPGVIIAGKTGTAQILRNGEYSEDTMASFIGFAPARSPQLLVAVVIDSPRLARFGGDAAAPVFARVMEDSLTTLKQVVKKPQLAASQTGVLQP